MKSKTSLLFLFVILILFSCKKDEISGCTNPAASNYNNQASVDDGSCILPGSGPVDVLGCTDPLSSNYNSAATIDDGSCTYANAITGNLDLDINFPISGNESISISVPSSYYHTTNHGITVCTHGAIEPNSPEEMRDFLAPLTDSLENMIVICLSPTFNGGQAPHLDNIALLNEVIDTLTQLYSIDLSRVYILGNNLGGITAMDYVFQPPTYDIKGMILFSPEHWITGYTPDYASSATYPPMGLMAGQLDTETTIFHNNIINNGGVSQVTLIPGVGNSMDDPAVMGEIIDCYEFIDAN